MKVYVGRSRASNADVAAVCAAASLDLNRITRSLHQTAARPRTGKHSKLSPEERERRKSDRMDRQRKRRLQQETLAELAEHRAARKRQREEDRWWKTTIRIKVPKEERSKVTWSGGRSLYRQRSRFELVVLPTWSNTSFEQTALVWRIKSRSLGGNGPGRYRRGECARFARYLTNIIALEAAPDEAILTSIVPPDVPRDSDAFARELVTFLNAAEDLEGQVDAGGQLYKSIIIPLPHDIGFDRRREIARSYARQFDRHKLPYVIAMHAPDPGGDRRNYHLHALVLTRAFERIGDHEWTFAKVKSRDVFHPAMLKVWRRYTVNLFNHHLAAVGSDRRYSLRAATAPGEHRGRVRTIEDRRAVDIAHERTRADRDLRGAILECARTLVVVAKRHVETGMTLARTRRALLERLKAECTSVRAAHATGRQALERAALLAEARRRIMAARKRKDDLAKLGRLMELRHVLAARVTDVAADSRDLADMAKRVASRRLSGDIETMSARLQMARQHLNATSLRAGQRERIDYLRNAISGMAAGITDGRRNLDGTSDMVGRRIRYLLTHMNRGIGRHRAMLDTVRQSALRQHVINLRDGVARARDNLATDRSSLSQLRPVGLKAQASLVSGAAKTISVGSAAPPVRSKGRTVASPGSIAASTAVRGDRIDLPAFDLTVRGLPILAGSVIANGLSDLRAAMRDGLVALYREGPNIRIVTDDPGVKDIIARLQAAPRGKAMLLRIARPPETDERTDPNLEAARPKVSSQTAVPSLTPTTRAVSQVPENLQAEVASPDRSPDTDPKSDLTRDDRRGGAER